MTTQTSPATVTTGRTWTATVAAARPSRAPALTLSRAPWLAGAMTATRLMTSVLAVLAAAVVATPASAQRSLPDTGGAAPVTVPFGVGEHAVYRVSYNIVGRVGTGSMQIVGIDTVRGHPAFHALFTLQGRFLFARVDNRFESWLDVRDVFSHRFEQQTREINFRRNRIREFYPAELRWTGHTNDRQESGTLSSAMPLDDTAFLYFVRTLKLEVGREYSFDRYWNPEGNPVRIRVLRRETVTVPAGTFDTVVLQPIIRTSGLFSEGGEAEVYFAEDGARQLVMLRAKVSFGTLQLQLEEFTPADLAPVVRND
jgi:hypothetical protein